MNLSWHRLFDSAILTLLILAAGTGFEVKSARANLKFETQTQVIQGQSGGPVDSKGCGFIASSPNHTLEIDKRIDYMRLTVQSQGGEPTLLVIGPNSSDSFCALADNSSGFKPEISGVWEPGIYEIYVGDRSGSSHQFTLDISTAER